MEKIPNMIVVTPSYWLGRMVNKSFLNKYPVCTIHNGIDTSVFSPKPSDFKRKYGIENKYMVLGVSTSWDEMKGLSDYKKVANMLGDEYVVVLVGFKDNNIKSIPANMIGIRRTNNTSDLAGIYSSADLFLNLSYCENYPTVNLEAIACGTQVLTYDSGGSSESAINGLIVSRGDIKEVVEKIVNYKESSKPYKNPISDCIDKRVTVNKYVNLYFGKAIQNNDFELKCKTI